VKALWLLALAGATAFGQANGQAHGPGHGQARPQLGDAEAARHQVTDYLAQGPTPWAPAPLGDGRAWRPDFVVARDGSGTHLSVQSALDAVPARARGDKRVYIHVKPGNYREQVCARDKAPITLYGDAADPAAAVIAAGHYNAETKRPGIDSANPCDPALAASSFGTAGSATAAFFSDDLQLAHLTIANDSVAQVRDGVGYPAGAGESGGAQGVALMTQGDRVQLENVQLLGHQDTFYARAGRGAARVFVQRSLIAGDVDFIFGNATLVLDNCTVLSRAGRRKPGNGGHVLAPSTAADTRLGFLVTRSRFIAEPGVPDASISLGRAWDLGVPHGRWQAGVSPNGQALVRDSSLGAHLAPWGASTSRRPFDPANHRLTEYRNTTVTAAARDVARESLAKSDGWAAAEGGTRGGADAAPADVTEVHNRAELVAALVPHPRPRIVTLRGRIDLSVDAQNRPLGVDDYRDPAFDLEAYARAYDPATWGKRPPSGPLEDARRRSARRQAETVVVRVPSNTTLLGLGSEAQVVGGMLLLDGVDNVVVRNIHFADAYDHFPAWDPNDNASGEWNADYDNLSLRGATHVWIDHNTFDDGTRPDASERVLLGRRMQRHDGLLDITRQSNHVTVSWNHFRGHDKTSIVGGSDAHTTDAGKLKVTFHHNLWEHVRERAPRVRYGEVHLYNNLHVAGPEEGFAYSIGVGLQSRIFSERNAWEAPASVPAARLVRLHKGTAFTDRESLLNGQPVDLLGALRAASPSVVIDGDVGWRPALHGPLDAARDVPARVRAGAGAGRLAAAAIDPSSFSVRGWAAATKGGQGGRIIKVTTLGAAGPGSLHEALQAEGPRIVVFEVGGVIDMQGRKLVVKSPYLTVAGQTAPSPGITIIKAETIIATHDVIVQHLRFRPGEFGRPKRGGGDQDGISTASGAYNVIVDHCSFSWATDENLSASGERFSGTGPDAWRQGTSHDITYSHNLIYESLSHSVHEKGEHSKGSLIHDNATGILLYRNVYASNKQRNALFKGGARGAMVNNLIFNPGDRAVHYNLLADEWGAHPYQTGRLTLIGNVFRPGPSTAPGTPLFTLEGEGDLELYLRDNLVTDPAAPQAVNRSGGKAQLLGSPEPHVPADIKILPAAQIALELPEAVGARPWDRDALDTLLLVDMAAGRGRIIDAETENALGYPTHTPTARPFVADDWRLDDMSPKQGWAAWRRAIKSPWPR
jgi:pectate lyase/pectin methylesterase-like acyl-CoA thioesterase